VLVLENASGVSAAYLRLIDKRDIVLTGWQSVRTFEYEDEDENDVVVRLCCAMKSANLT
jgi:hypothetical protein